MLDEYGNEPSKPLTRSHLFAGVAVILAGMLLGSAIVLRMDRPGKSQRPLIPSNGTNPPAARRLPLGMSPASDRAWTNGMVWVEGGSFLMGADSGFPDELPVHRVEVDGFWMDKTEVTNAEFERYVKATGYVTVAERTPKSEDFPGVPLERLKPGSVVFQAPEGEVSLEDYYKWWSYVPGADWSHPKGPGSSIVGMESHPVVHIAWEDAAAYAAWAGKRLPTEAEWERAARGGLEGQPYVWGQELRPEGRWAANTWQGEFPKKNSAEDGFLGTSPVGSFAPNRYGLFDMSGNVWEWCQDWYRPDYYEKSPSKNPQGPVDSFDPNEPGVFKRVQRGGSFLCSDVYCSGYRPSARMKASPDTGLSHSGFRCVRN